MKRSYSYDLSLLNISLLSVCLILLSSFQAQARDKFLTGCLSPREEFIPNSKRSLITCIFKLFSLPIFLMGKILSINC
jgi:hypothetical protein